MLESWSVSNNETVKEHIHFDPVIPHYQDRINQFNGQQLSREDYQRYGWLFGMR
jgi:hypothetical protein